MLKKYGKTMLLSSILTLLPIAVGLALWNRLPDTMNIHWKITGEADGTAGKAFAVFFLPLLLLAMHWLCAVITHRTNKDNDQTPKAIKLVLWITPILSNAVMGTMYATSLGQEINMNRIFFVPMGILFIVIGNFMPKVRRNDTIGVKTRWSLADDENWYATHRFAGKVWVTGGILMLSLCFLPTIWGVSVMVAAMLLLAVAPLVYSWRFYKKQQAVGKEPRTYRSPIGKGAWVCPAVLVLFLAVILFTGSITFEVNDKSMTVDSTFYSPLTVSYEDIDSIELRAGKVSGLRDWGFASARLLLGGFSNEEFGGYTRYTYTFSDAYIVITAGDNILVLADRDAASTQILYDTLRDKIG